MHDGSTVVLDHGGDHGAPSASTAAKAVAIHEARSRSCRIPAVSAGYPGVLSPIWGVRSTATTGWDAHRRQYLPAVRRGRLRLVVTSQRLLAPRKVEQRLPRFEREAVPLPSRGGLGEHPRGDVEFAAGRGDRGLSGQEGEGVPFRAHIRPWNGWSASAFSSLPMARNARTATGSMNAR